MTSANGSQQPERGALDYPTLDLANSWTGVSFWTPDPMIVKADGRDVALSGYDSLRRSPALYSGNAARLEQLGAVNNVLMHGVNGIDAQDYDEALRAMATTTKATANLLDLSPAELEKHRAALTFLRERTQAKRRDHVAQRITEMGALVRTMAPSLWARAEVIVAPSRRPKEIDNGRVMSAMFRLTDVRLDSDAEGAPTPFPLFKDKEGNEGVYPGDFSLFIQERPETK